MCGHIELQFTVDCAAAVVAAAAAAGIAVDDDTMSAHYNDKR